MQASRILIRGIVQGVGFRPTVVRVANSLNLRGWVCNTLTGVEIIIGTKSTAEFLTNLNNCLPRLAVIESINTELIEIDNLPPKFKIVSSINNDASTFNKLITPDSCTCLQCITDIFNPDSRFYLYPFTSCSDCGPRYSVINNLPYDRSNTIMLDFQICEDCKSDYNEVNNRRFHSDLICCKKCGPTLEMDIENIANYLIAGKIVAVKVLTGYVLIANANNIETIKLLRERKFRPNKPFALMALNTTSIKDNFCNVNSFEEKLLKSKEAPIVLLKRNNCEHFSIIAPGINTLGFMLPSNPIYYLIFYYLLGKPQGLNWINESNTLALVVTSANFSGNSIISENQDARSNLPKIADFIIGHNRKIFRKSDDSVTIQLDEDLVLLRRSRGYAPKPYIFDYTLPEVLGLGSEQKSTFCFTRNKNAFLSQYIGDMSYQSTINSYHELLKYHKDIYSFSPKLLVSDLHPNFYTNNLAQDLNVLHIQLQHHHAHFSATIADYQSNKGQIKNELLGCILDGYGFGVDGNNWGGELFKFNTSSLNFKRVSHFPLILLPFVDSGEKDPWKIAILWCLKYKLNIPDHILLIPQAKLLIKLYEMDENTDTSSLGRLFSMVSSLLGICNFSSYESEAVLRLESLVSKLEFENEYANLTFEGIPDIPKLIERIYYIAYFDKDIVRAVNVFYGNMILIIYNWIVYHASFENVNQVAISGGCWQSRYLLPLIKKMLTENGIELITPKNTPLNDECISLGQAWYGVQCILKGKV